MATNRYKAPTEKELEGMPPVLRQDIMGMYGNYRLAKDVGIAKRVGAIPEDIQGKVRQHLIRAMDAQIDSHDRSRFLHALLEFPKPELALYQGTEDKREYVKDGIIYFLRHLNGPQGFQAETHYKISSVDGALILTKLLRDSSPNIRHNAGNLLNDYLNMLKSAKSGGTKERLFFARELIDPKEYPMSFNAVYERLRKSNKFRGKKKYWQKESLLYIKRENKELTSIFLRGQKEESYGVIKGTWYPLLRELLGNKPVPRGLKYIKPSSIWKIGKSVDNLVKKKNEAGEKL
jgi:hypothetical protein